MADVQLERFPRDECVALPTADHARTWLTFPCAPTVYQFEKKDPKRAGQKAQHVLRSCMIRRRKDTKLDGKELVSLPAKNLHLLDLQFSPEEREICKCR